MTNLGPPARLVLLALLASAAAFAEIPETVKPEDVPNYRRISPSLATAGQPTEAALKKAKELGFATFVNLRTPRKGSRPTGRSWRRWGSAS